MANGKVDEMIDEIRAIHWQEDGADSLTGWEASDYERAYEDAHQHRATLLAEVKRLLIVKELHVAAVGQIADLQKEVERLRVMLNPPEESLELSRAAQRMLDYMKETDSSLPLYNAYRNQQQAEARLAELVERLKGGLAYQRGYKLAAIIADYE